MADTSTSARFLLVLSTDRDAKRTGEIWSARCIHCRKRHQLTAAGQPITAATIEHIVPQSWFEQKAALPLTSNFNGPHDPQNMAIACSGCNNQKGRTHDIAGPRNARALEVVQSLLQRRIQSWLTEPSS